MSPLVEFLKTNNEPSYDNPEFNDWFKQYCNLRREEIPNCPFTIELDVDELIKLDAPFTDEPEIFIRDDRSRKCGWKDDYVPDYVSNLHDTNISVKQIDNKPITLRQILEKMAKTPEYRAIKNQITAL